MDIEELKKLLSPKTRLVACTHASNILGTINDVKMIAETVHTVKGAMLMVDGVAYAPHREIDVKELGVDFYTFSWYKVNHSFISCRDFADNSGLWSAYSHVIWFYFRPEEPRFARPLLQPHNDTRG
jgi:hypothetical protein